MNGLKMVVDGFLFMDEKAAQKARQEEDSIRYVKDRLDMSNPRMVQEMYHKLLAERVFETPVGLLYLKDLQDYLVSAPEMAGEQIEAIPLLAANVPQPAGQAKAGQATAPQPAGQAKAGQATAPQPAGQVKAGQALTPPAAARQQETLEWYAEKLEESRQQERLSEYRRRRAEERAKDSRKRLRLCLLFALFMGLVTVGVGAVTMTDQNPNIINYENKIIEKYQDWEADLENREEALKQKELGQTSSQE